MRYEWDIAWRYLHPAAIGYFYLVMLALLLLWGGLYGGAVTGILYLFHQGHIDWLGRVPFPAYRTVGLLVGVVVIGLLSLYLRRRSLRFFLTRGAVLVCLAIIYDLAIRTRHLDDILELDPALLVATALVAGTVLRPTMRVPFITVLTSTSMFGVALGVASIIVVLSVMNGFDKDFHKKILGVKSHVVFADGRGIPQWKRAIETLRGVPGAVSVQPAAEGLALLKVRQVRSVWVRGVDPAAESTDSFLRRSVLVGSLDELAHTAAPTTEEVDVNDLVAESVPVLIGSELAKLLFGVSPPPNLSPEEEKAAWSVVLGRPLQLIAAEMGRSAMGVPPTAYGRVAGVFATKFYDFDAGMVFVGLETGQRLYGLGGSVNRIEVRLNDYDPSVTRRYAEAARLALQEQLDISLFPDTWMDLDRIFYESLVLERRVMGLILSIIVLVASCSILTTLVMVVMEKTRDIGVMRAIGATPQGILRMFVAQGMLIGLMGTAAGCLLAVAVCWFILWLKLPMPGGNSIYYIDRLPVHMEFEYFFNVVAYTFLLSFLATLYPAHRAPTWRRRGYPVRMSGDMNEPAVVLEAVSKSYLTGQGPLHVLREVSLSIPCGEFIAVVGASGAGKSTLLHIMGGLDHPTSGRATLMGVDLTGLEEPATSHLRNRRVGFVFQFHHLLPEFSALENVMMPARIDRRAERETRARARQLLEIVGVADRAEHRPGELSGGERQRVAIARAMINQPSVLLLDEPTGNLDRDTGLRVFEAMLALREAHNTTTVMVTHNFELANRADRMLKLLSGTIQHE